jgi:penicillin-binding protein 2
MAIGQGNLLVTPIQMADMLSMVVNNGTIYRPHVLKEVRDASSGALIKRTERETLHTSRVSAETFSKVRDDMRMVVSEGTARYPLGIIKAVKVAGKTGTGEMGLLDRWHSWFASFAPADYADPKDVVAVAVIVEASNAWEAWAPYASAIINQGIFTGQTFEEAVSSLGLEARINKPQERME